MLLNDEERRMLDGECGTGSQMAMSLLKRWGEAFDAEKMVKANIVHISTNIPIDLLEKMSEGVRQVRTSCSLHAIFDPKLWREKYGVVAQKNQLIAGGAASTNEQESSQRLNILRELGVYPTFTCIPYAIGFVPRPGDVFIGTGSSGQVITNSLFAARAGRESMSTAFAAAITGVTPLMGNLKKENRYAEVLIELEGIDFNQFTDADYGALGYYIGGIADQRNVAVNNINVNLTFEQCKYLLSPLPVSGACTICHLVGITPEAPSLDIAFGGKKPKEHVKIGNKEMKKAYEMLNNAADRNVDLVTIGCPHLFISELKELASMLEGNKISKNSSLLVCTSNATYSLAKDAGYTQIIESSGAIISNCCGGPTNPLVYLGDVRVTATNSARAAHYIQRMSANKVKTLYGNVRECINAAITGKWGY